MATAKDELKKLVDTAKALMDKGKTAQKTKAELDRLNQSTDARRSRSTNGDTTPPAPTTPLR